MDKLLKPIKYRINQLEKQLELMNNTDHEFKIKDEVAARLDELESLLEFYQTKYQLKENCTNQDLINLFKDISEEE